MGCLNPSEVRTAIDIMHHNMVNSVETCFYNNVFIDTTIVDVNIDIRNNLRLRMLLNKKDAPT